MNFYLLPFLLLLTYVNTTQTALQSKVVDNVASERPLESTVFLSSNLNVKHFHKLGLTLFMKRAWLYGERGSFDLSSFELYLGRIFRVLEIRHWGKRISSLLTCLSASFFNTGGDVNETLLLPLNP